MKRGGAISMRIVLWGLAVALGSVVVLGPVGVQAAEMSTETLQLLPPGTQTCKQPAVSDFKAYTYEGALHSFEFIVSDLSYVAVLGTIGGAPINFGQMTRLAGPAGTLKVHVDVPTTRISGTLPLVITMVSPGTAGAPVCALMVKASVAGPVVTTPASTSAPKALVVPETKPVPSEGVEVTDGGAATSSGPAVAGTVSCPIANVSALWVFGLALYAMLVASLVLGDKRPYLDVEPRVLLALIAVPLLAIAGIWLYSVACRADWAPLTALAIAIAGTVTAYRNDSNLFRWLVTI